MKFVTNKAYISPLIKVTKSENKSFDKILKFILNKYMIKLNNYFQIKIIIFNFF